MKTTSKDQQLFFLMIHLFLSSIFLNQCEARGSRQFKTSSLTTIQNHKTNSRSKKLLEVHSIYNPHSLTSTLTNNNDASNPMTNHDNNPLYCVYPPLNPRPPSNPIPTPTIPIKSPPSPFIYYYSPPRHVSTPPEFSPGPPIFLPPIVYPPPLTPPPPVATRTMPGLWCVAKPTVPDPIIQEAMDYACGSGADCESIRLNGLCFQPNTLLAHASYAFNSYWQRTKVAGGTCDFGGAAILITSDPSYDSCQYKYM